MNFAVVYTESDVHNTPTWQQWGETAAFISQLFCPLQPQDQHRVIIASGTFHIGSFQMTRVIFLQHLAVVFPLLTDAAKLFAEWSVTNYDTCHDVTCHASRSSHTADRRDTEIFSISWRLILLYWCKTHYQTRYYLNYKSDLFCILLSRSPTVDCLLPSAEHNPIKAKHT